jgi:uncharacterized membrane protein YsdA (DUF1294 family)
MTAQTVQSVSMTSYFLYGILIYLVAINIVAFFLYGIDKWKAQRNKWRVTEARLLWIAVAGGSIGALLGMKIWHHKTQHAKFRFGLPAILILQIAAVLAALYYYYFVN